METSSSPNWELPASGNIQVEANEGLLVLEGLTLGLGSGTATAGSVPVGPCRMPVGLLGWADTWALVQAAWVWFPG